MTKLTLVRTMGRFIDLLLMATEGPVFRRLSDLAVSQFSCLGHPVVIPR